MLIAQERTKNLLKEVIVKIGLKQKNDEEIPGIVEILFVKVEDSKLQTFFIFFSILFYFPFLFLF